MGNTLIDQEHKYLFELLQKFYLGLQGKVSKLEIDTLVKGLLDYAVKHFVDEEAFMVQVGYPDLERHKGIHRDFLAKATDFAEKLESGKMVLSIEVTNFIKDWLVTHIKGEDMKIIRYAHGN